MSTALTCPNPRCRRSVELSGSLPVPFECPVCGTPLGGDEDIRATRDLSGGPTDPDDARGTLPLPDDTADPLTLPLPGTAAPSGGPTDPDDARETAALPSGSGAGLPANSAGGSSAAFGPDPLTQVGRFRVQAELGRGAFGIVYKAYDPQLDRTVALKVARPGSLNTPERVDRFVREAKAAANLRHPHIVPVFDSGTDGDRYYMAAAYIEGQTLERLAQQAAEDDEPVPPERAADLVRKLADALAYAHREGVVHRDVKPANVLVDGKGEPLLTDFGLAARGATDADAGRVLGTAAYMAPEQADGRGVAASDQYSLGCTLYELLTGRTPFAGSAAQQAFLHKTQPPPPPRAVRPDVPRDLDAVCRKAMAKVTVDRYPSCGGLADDLRRFLAGEPVLARPAGTAEKIWKWARRSPALAGVAAALAVVTPTGGAVAAVGWVRAMDREKQAADLARSNQRIADDNQKIADENKKIAAQESDARRKADDARREAEREAARTRQAVAFLTQMFQTSDPLAFATEVFPGAATAANLSARDLLLGGAAKVRAALAADPDNKATLMLALGTALRNQGLLAEAKPILEEAHAGRQARLAKLPADAPARREAELAAAESEFQLAALALDRGDAEQAERLFRAVLAVQERHAVPEADRVTTLMHVAWALAMFDHPDAPPLLREVIAARTRLVGATHSDTLIAKAGLAAVLLDNGRRKEAGDIAVELLGVLGRLPDGRAKKIAEVLGQFQAGMAAGEVNGWLAERSLRAALDNAATVLPPGHVYGTLIRFELAKQLQNRGQIAEAEKLYRECLPDCRRIGFGHPKVLELVQQFAAFLATYRQAGGGVDEGRRLFAESLAATRERFGPDAVWLAEVHLAAVEFEADHGDDAAARRHAADALRLIRGGRLRPSRQAVTHVKEAALALMRQNLPEALPLAEASLAWIPRAFPGQGWAVGVGQNDLAYCLRKAGRLADAEAAAGTAEPLLAAGVATEPPLAYDLAEVRLLRGELALPRLDYAAAERHCRDGLAVADPLPRGHWLRVDLHKARAAALAGRGRYADAAAAWAAATAEAAAGETKPSPEQVREDRETAALLKAAAGDPGAADAVRDLAATAGDDPRRLREAGRAVAACPRFPTPEAAAVADRLAALKGRLPKERAVGLALAGVLLRAGKPADAGRELDRLPPVSGGHPADEYLRAWAAAASGDPLTAEAHLSAADALLARYAPTAADPYAGRKLEWISRLRYALLRRDALAAAGASR